MIPTAILLAAVTTSGHQVEVVRPRVIVRQQPTQVLYLVGADTRYSAMLRAIIRDELSKAGLKTAKSEPVTAVSVHCGRCHSGDTPKGDLLLGQDLPAELVTQSIRRLASGEMPPDRQLSRDEKNAVMTDLLNLETTPKPAPTPETLGEE